MSNALADLMFRPDAEGPADRLRVALDLHEAGMDLLREKMRRDEPTLTESELKERVSAWLLDTPMQGDNERRLPWQEWVARR